MENIHRSTWKFRFCIKQLSVACDQQYPLVNNNVLATYYVSVPSRANYPLLTIFICCALLACPKIMADLVKSCWAPKPSERPTTIELLKTLEQISECYKASPEEWEFTRTVN